MPNHVFNVLHMVGPRHVLDAIVADVAGREQPLSFRKVIPPPDPKMVDTNEGYNNAQSGHPSGYDWCNSHWGTKWDAYDFPEGSWEYEGTEYNGSHELMVLRFHTAWSPPLPVIRALSEKYRDVLFSLHYEESGSGFIGDYETKDGLVTLEAARSPLSVYDSRLVRGG